MGSGSATRWTGVSSYYKIILFAGDKHTAIHFYQNIPHLYIRRIVIIFSVHPSFAPGRFKFLQFFQRKFVVTIFIFYHFAALIKHRQKHTICTGTP